MFPDQPFDDDDGGAFYDEDDFTRIEPDAERRALRARTSRKGGVSNVAYVSNHNYGCMLLCVPC